MKDIVLPLLAGMGCGVLSAWGVGGGTLLLLVMTLFFGVDQAAAQGVNLLYFLPTAAMGLIWHRQNGLLDKALLRRTVPWALVTAAAASWAATALDVTLLAAPLWDFSPDCRRGNAAAQIGPAPFREISRSRPCIMDGGKEAEP